MPNDTVPASTLVPSVRIAPDTNQVLADLGPLADLAGTWQGHGFNLVARPNLAQNANLFLELNLTRERLKFDPISTSIPNRGFGQGDVRAVRPHLPAADHRPHDGWRAAYRAGHLDQHAQHHRPDATAQRVPHGLRPARHLVAGGRRGDLFHRSSSARSEWRREWRQPGFLAVLVIQHHALRARRRPAAADLRRRLVGTSLCPARHERRLLAVHAHKCGFTDQSPHAAGQRPPGTAAGDHPDAAERSRHDVAERYPAAGCGGSQLRRHRAEHCDNHTDLVRHRAEPGRANYPRRDHRRRRRPRQHPVPAAERGLSADLRNVLADESVASAKAHVHAVAVCPDGAAELPGAADPELTELSWPHVSVATLHKTFG